jgi:hypothetical protein
MIEPNLQQAASEIFSRVVNEPAAIHDLLAKFETYSDSLLVELFKNPKAALPLAADVWM